MKAIIPVAGAGTRLRPHTYTQPKALIPLAGKSILSFIIDQLKDAGINEFIFIIGYLGEKIQDYVLTNYPQINATFITQNDRIGLGHAIELAQDAVGTDEVMIVLGDTIAEFNAKEIINTVGSLLAVKKVDDPQNFGVAQIDDSGMIVRVVEKPTIPISNYALVGVYKISETTELFSCLRQIDEEKRGGYSGFTLTEALDCMLKKGISFQSFKVENWFDCGKRETLLKSNSTLLKKYGGQNEESLNYTNTIIISPVSIGAGCIIRNSVIGPNVTIGEHSTITKSIIRDSIIGSYAELKEIVLDNSLIGSDAEVKGVSRNLNIGDNTAIDLGGSNS